MKVALLCCGGVDEVDTRVPFRPKVRVGGWLPTNVEDLDTFLSQVTTAASVAQEKQVPLIKPIADLESIVNQDPALRANVDTMFRDAAARQRQTPLKTKAIDNFESFLEAKELCSWFQL